MAQATGGLCTTRCQLFNDEVTRRENSLRMKWFLKNRQRLLDNLQDPKLVDRAEKNRAKFEEERARRQKEVSDIHEEDKKLPVWRLPKSDGSVNLDVMRPIEPSTRSILYENEVESYITGHNYLHERYKDKPENRFYFPDCANWLYGWRLADYPPVSGTKFGRSSIIQESFYRRNGSSLRRDPESNRKCQTTNPKDFNDILTY